MASIEQARAALAPHGGLAPKTAAEHRRGDIALPPAAATIDEQVAAIDFVCDSNTEAVHHQSVLRAEIRFDLDVKVLAVEPTIVRHLLKKRMGHRSQLRPCR